jgi:hypothetical protein
MTIGAVGEVIASRGFAHASDRRQCGEPLVDGGAAGAALTPHLRKGQRTLAGSQGRDDTIVDR